MEWKQELKNSITEVEQLLQQFPQLQMDSPALQELIRHYPMRIPQYYLSLADREDLNDPILKMCVPSINELARGGAADTSGESNSTMLQGLQHKYGPTVLILSTNRCAMYCRHCFRKRLVGISDEEIARRLVDIVAYIREHEEISNVLISGGDAFMNSNTSLRQLLEHLCAIPHLRMIRFGSRVPVVLPSRIYGDENLLDLLEDFGQQKQLYVVTQFNHPHEITSESQSAIQALLDRNVMLSNQTVLLRGVNNQPAIIAELMNRIVEIGVIPYYIFQCRPVAGVHHHFQLPLLNGYHVIEEAKKSLSGHAKRFRFIMSHARGKIEILGLDHTGYMIFKYHMAHFDEDQGRVFRCSITPEQLWLDDQQAST